MPDRRSFVLPLSWLPPDVSLTATLILLGASFVASFITAAFGIGGGIFLLAFFASLVPAAALIPVHAVVQIGSNFGRAAILVRHIVWEVFPPFLVGTLIGAVAGGTVVVALPPAAVQIAIGVFILWSVFFSPPAIMRRVAWLTAVIASFLTMFFGATGPFVISYLKTLRFERHGLVATHASVMTMQHMVKALVFGFLGFAFAPWGLFIAAMIAAGFLGTLAGSRILARIDERRFQFALNAILVVMALRLVWAGTAEWLATTGT